MTVKELIKELQLIEDPANVFIAVMGQQGKLEIRGVHSVVVSNKFDVVLCSNDVNHGDVANGYYN